MRQQSNSHEPESMTLSIVAPDACACRQLRTVLSNTEVMQRVPSGAGSHQRDMSEATRAAAAHLRDWAAHELEEKLPQRRNLYTSSQSLWSSCLPCTLS